MIGLNRDATQWLSASLALDDWMRQRGYAGHDPFDLLASPLVRRMSLGSRLLERAWTRLGTRSPLGLRRALRIPPARSPKGIGLVLAAYARLHEAIGGDRYRDRATELVAWLVSNVTPGYSGACWGYTFPWANRDFYAPAGTPASVPTVFIGHALFDAAERLKIDGAHALALSACDFLSRDLNRIAGDDGTLCVSYTPLDRGVVHSASLLSASLLARGAAASGSTEWRDLALRAARYSANAQRPDGAWLPGAAAPAGWVDSVQASYNLVALHEVGTRLGVDAFDAAIARGIAYWRRTFVRGPAVSYDASSAYPIDLHAVAHAILTFVALRGRISDGMSEACRLAGWALDEMRSERGFFYYQRHRFFRNRVAYMRWTQAWMLRALAELAAASYPGGLAAPARAPTSP